MFEQDILYLASQSLSRKQLLKLAQIPFKTIDHASDERSIVQRFNFDDYVLDIAKDKMRTVILPHTSQHEADFLFVVTADTMARDEKSGEVFGKPADVVDAKRMLGVIRQRPIQVATGCCVHKFSKLKSEWELVDAVEWTTQGLVEFYVDQEMEDTYLTRMPGALYGCGASIVEDYGYNFLKSVQGSFTAVLGLPIYELRHALVKLEFRF